MTGIIFVNTGNAFLPELDAYMSHLELLGYKVFLAHSMAETADFKNKASLVFRFAGLLRKDAYSDLPEIHNYNSASTGIFPKLKDTAKSFLATKPVGRIYLNEYVASRFNFRDDLPFIFRDMGADSAFFDARRSASKSYDIVYAGSISGRPGLINCLKGLNNKNIRIGLAGVASIAELKEIRTLQRVDYVGRLNRNEVAKFISLGKFGLNYCPNKYPFNKQTSTKVIEYLAAGIGILSNKYDWIDAHSAEYNYEYINIDNVHSIADLVPRNEFFLAESVALSFEWNRLLNECGFSNFIKKFCPVN